MTRRLSSMIAGIAAAAALTLTGCSGGVEAPQPAAEQPSQTTAQQPPSSESAAPTDSDTKPAKTDIVEGLTKFYIENQNLAKDKAKKFANCMVDETYDVASAQTLAAMRDGDPTKINADDAQLFAKAGVACAGALQ